MTEPKAASLRVDGPCRPEAVLRAAKQIRKKLGAPAKAAFVFAAADFLPQAEELCEILRVDGHIRDVAGCAVTGQVCDGKEFEGAQGFSVLALAGGVSEPVACERGLGAVAGADGAVLLQSGISEDFDARLAEWDRKFPGSALAGGVTGRARDGGPCVFLNGRRVESVVVPAADGACVLPFAAQGCRPIGEPLTVTRADHNILYSLGGQPAYRVLERAFETLSDDEKSRAKGNLFVGLAGNEYLEEFRSGDFLIKNIIGADPDSGAVVIGGLPRIGQTLQYQIRNRESALADLQRAFKPAGKAKKRAVAALLFSCVGRGANFFGVESPDASGLRAVLGRKPAAGFLSAAEIAPVAGTTALHGYTAVAAVFARKEE